MNTPESQVQIPASETHVAPIEPATVPAAKAAKNVLKTLQIVKLHDWVTLHAADCRVTTDSKLAGIAQEELGFPVTSANIAGMRGGIGIDKAKKDPVPSPDQRLEQERLVALERRVEHLEFKMSELSPAFDLPAPPADHPTFFPPVAAE